MLGPRPGTCGGWGLLWCYRHVGSPGSEPLTQSCGILAPRAACRRAATSESARAQRDELSLLPCLRSAGKMLQRLSGEKANYAGWLCFEKLVMCKQRRKTRVSARCQAGSGPATQGKALLHASARRRAGELALRGSCGGTALPPALPAAGSMGKKKHLHPGLTPACPAVLCHGNMGHFCFLLCSCRQPLEKPPGLFGHCSRGLLLWYGAGGGSDVRGVQAGPCCPHHNPPARAAAEPQHLILALGGVGGGLRAVSFPIPCTHFAPLPSPQAARPKGTQAASGMRALAAPFGPPAAC